MMAMKLIRLPLMTALFVAGLAASTAASADSARFDKMVAFGDSLMDPGNAYARLGQVSRKPYEPVPLYPYNIGAFHYSNGKTWIEQLGSWLGLGNSAGPATKSTIKASNFAFGGATARNGASTLPSANEQIALYFAKGEPVSADTLFVYGFGGNDVRHALATQDPTIIQEAIYDTATNLLTLCVAGARTLLVANTPNVGITPALRSLGPAAAYSATNTAAILNAGVSQAIEEIVKPNCPATTVILLDTFALTNQVAADPSAFGFTSLEPCLKFGASDNAICKNPNGHFFWDGIHPTRTGHALLASEALAAVTD